MKYDTQIGELKTKLDAASSVLVVLPKEVNTDKLAAALSLYLSLKQAGKAVSIVSESELKVSQATLFGIGEIKSTIPESSGGNLTLVLEGVVEGEKVPALEKLDWYPAGNNLNLVFHVQPGKKFEPINITHRYDTATFQIIFFIGGSSFADFGGVYMSNMDKLAEAIKVNINNSSNNNLNNLFGQINIVDPDTASISEMVFQVLQALGLGQDGDITTNIINGIYSATNNLRNNISADTFLVIGQAMQMGGKVSFAQIQQNQGGLDISKFGKQSTDYGLPSTAKPFDSAQGKQEENENQKNQPAEVEKSEEPKPEEQTAKSQYEVPTGEQVTSGGTEAPAPDWLTPKVFKGGSLG